MKRPETCHDLDPRRRLARARGINGIDYVEQDADDPKLFHVFFLGKAPRDVTEANVRIEGGVRVRDVAVAGVGLCALEGIDEDDCMRVWTDKLGDQSVYTLSLVEAERGRPGRRPLAGFDPLYAQADFTFTAHCPSDFDCLPYDTCPPETHDEPEIDYLAKDYASFRQLILDRLSLVMPDWRERHVPDIGVALVELLAYVGDYLSYYQDAVATEAYLETARQRVSVRRHAELVDYHMHEGCNARAWVHVQITGAGPEGFKLEDPRDYFFITAPGGPQLPADKLVLQEEEDLRGVPSELYEVFEPLLHPQHPVVTLYDAHNEIRFYTWAQRECCLPRGATSATLLDGPPPRQPGQSRQEPVQYQEGPGRGVNEGGGADKIRRVAEQHLAEPGLYGEGAEVRMMAWAPAAQHAPPPRQAAARKRVLNLRAGDVLIFEEVRGPKTHAQADADPSHRHAVRLTRVEPVVDELTGANVVNIEWALEDALPFPLCVSTIGRAPECEYRDDISVARGNVILCDHGRTIGPERHDVPEAEESEAGCYGEHDPRETTLKPVRFAPKLKRPVVTHAVEYPRTADVARQQSRALGGVLALALARVEELRRRARGGTALGLAEYRELRTIFGEKALANAGLEDPRPRRGRRQPPQSPAEQAAAVGRLSNQADRLLEKKARRLEVLRGRGLAGSVLSQWEMLEVEEMFGAAYIEEMSSRHTLGPAASAYNQTPGDAAPRVTAWRTREGAAVPWKTIPVVPRRQRKLWTPVRSLVGSSAADRHFVAEVDNEGFARLRFGEGELGRAPAPGSSFAFSYRVGNGRAGNVGAEAVSRVVFRKTKVSGLTIKVRNPLPARGGAEPETMADAKMFAPGAFRKQLQRAVTADDYASLAQTTRPESVQRAAGELGWGGSWYDVRVAVDPLGAASPPESLLKDLGWGLERYRRIGHDLTVLPAGYISLDISMTVCVKPHHLRAHVRRALLEAFGNGVLAGGRRGFFHPDNLTFGQDVHLSRLAATALAVPGVESVHFGRFHGRTLGTLQRLFEPEGGEIEAGVLRLSALEVARLDNDPNFPEHGRLVLDVRGGR
ncbi:MAG TPA: putative baseplate assembly protein [Pyrinomonadaceae bacterium]|nr:putative baseplate assembly protein [Pyrinomonadaceae bacterium]